MNPTDCIRHQKRTLRFSPKDVSPKLFEQLVENSGREGVEFIIIQNEQTKLVLSSDNSERDPLYEAPVVFAVLSSGDLDGAYQAAQDIMLLAEEQGLGTSYFPHSTGHHHEFENLLEIPRDVVLVGFVAIGWPDRESVAESVHTEATVHSETYGSNYKL